MVQVERKLRNLNPSLIPLTGFYVSADAYVTQTHHIYENFLCICRQHIRLRS